MSQVATKRLKLKAKIEVLQASISSSPYTLEQSIEADQKCSYIMHRLMNGEKPSQEDIDFMTNDDASKLKSDIDELEGYQATLDRDLTYCPKRYVVTSGKLLAPAGIHPSERIYKTLDVMIFSDTKPSKSDLPNCNVNLYITDLDNI